MDSDPYQSAFRAPVSAAKPRRTSWFQDWAVIAIAIATVLALLGVAAVAMVFAMSERRQLTELRSHTEDRLNDIDRELAALGAGLGEIIASNQVSRPDFSSHVLDLLEEDLKRASQKEDPIFAIETATAVARKAEQLKIQVDPQQLAKIAQGFLKLVADENPADPKDGRAQGKLSDPAIETVSALISYRSTLLEVPGRAQDGPVAHAAMLRLSKHSFVPFDASSSIFGSTKALGTETGNSVAKIDLLSLSEPMLTDSFRSVVIEGYTLKLDGFDVRNTVFSQCRIAYSGEPINLENVYFSHCNFQIGRLGKNFAAAVLSPTGQTSVVKR